MSERGFTVERVAVESERALVAAAIHTGRRPHTVRVLEAVTPADFADGNLGATWEALRSLCFETDDDWTVARIVERLDGIRRIPRASETVQELHYLGYAEVHRIDAHAHDVRDHARGRRMVAAIESWKPRATRGGDPTPLIEDLTALRDEITVVHGGDRLGLVDLSTIEDDPIVPTILEVEGGTPLFYEGAVTNVFGPGGIGKTWLALWTMLDAIRHGRPVLFIDYEGHPRSAAARLATLGATSSETARLGYLPGRPLDATTIREISRRAFAVVVIDSVSRAMTQHGYDENDNSAANAWFETVANPIARSGACVLTIDHPSKNAEVGKESARGATAKRDQVDAAYKVKGTPFSRTKPGTLYVRVDKDRHGHRALGDVAAEVHFTPGDDALTIAVRSDQSHDPATGTWRPTIYMERVSRWLEGQPADFEFTVSAFGGKPPPVTGKAEHLRAATQQLRAEGFLEARTEPRPGGIATFYRLARPFTCPDTPDSLSQPVPPLSPADVPQSVPTEPGQMSHLSHPLRGGRGDSLSSGDDETF